MLWTRAAVSTPGVAWGHGSLFLAVHWAGSHGGEGGSRALQVVCGSLSCSLGGMGGPWRGEKGACVCGGVCVSPQGLLCCFPSSRDPGRLSEECLLVSLWMGFPLCSPARVTEAQKEDAELVGGAAWI